MEKQNEPASALCSGDLLAAALDACKEAWNAFDNGKRKHHRDGLTGRCIVGCQACAVEKLRRVCNSAVPPKPKVLNSADPADNPTLNNFLFG